MKDTEMADRPIWTQDHIREELDWVRQYGKSRILGFRHDGTWNYGWACWCGDGYKESSWEKSVFELEVHMWSGFHK